MNLIFGFFLILKNNQNLNDNCYEKYKENRKINNF